MIDRLIVLALEDCVASLTHVLDVRQVRAAGAKGLIALLSFSLLAKSFQLLLF